MKKPLVFVVTPDRRFIDITAQRGLGRAKTRGRSTLFMDVAMNSRRRNKGGPDLIFMGYLGNERSRLRQFSYKNLGSRFRFRRISVLEKENRGRVVSICRFMIVASGRGEGGGGGECQTLFHFSNLGRLSFPFCVLDL